MNKAVIASIALVAVLSILISFTSAPPKQDHWLLTKFGWDIKVKTKSGQETVVPFLSQNADLALLIGTCSGEWVHKALKDQDVKPVLTDKGEGILAVWLVTYPNSTAGHYTEMVLTIVASTNPSTVTEGSDSIELVNAFGFDLKNVIYVYKLWLSDQFPIDYGRDLLGTDKYPMNVSKAGRGDGVHELHSTEASGSNLVQATISTQVSFFDQLSTSISLVGSVGLRTSIEAMLAPSLYHLMTPKNITPGLKGNPHALTYGYSPNMVVVHWDPAVDKFDTGKEFEEMQFVPKLKQLATDYCFVYFPPFIFLSY